jgi:hypothetical protein
MVNELFVGVDRALAARGYSLLVGNRDGGKQDARLIDLLLAGGADGVILLDDRQLPLPASRPSPSAFPPPIRRPWLPASTGKKAALLRSGTSWSWATSIRTLHTAGPRAARTFPHWL